jgi:hypothetical protein
MGLLMEPARFATITKLAMEITGIFWMLKQDFNWQLNPDISEADRNSLPPQKTHLDDRHVVLEADLVGELQPQSICH